MWYHDDEVGLSMPLCILLINWGLGSNLEKKVITQRSSPLDLLYNLIQWYNLRKRKNVFSVNKSSCIWWWTYEMLINIASLDTEKNLKHTNIDLK